MRMGIRTAAIAAMLIAVPAAAAEDEDDPDYFYFHKAGISKEAALADWEECRDLASAVEPPRGPSVYTPTVAGAAAAGLVQGFIRGGRGDTWPTPPSANASRSRVTAATE